MNFDNDEEVLGFINRLLQQLQQTGHTNQSSKIEFVYVASGGQHVETQIIASPSPPQGREKGAEEAFKGEKKGAEEAFKEDTPLSALFRDNHHEELRKVIESWRPYLVGDDPDKETLQLSHFDFDKDRIYSNKVYRDLCELDTLGALQVPLSQLARYLTDHSNLSRSYATLYQQLKYYRTEWR